MIITISKRKPPSLAPFCIHTYLNNLIQSVNQRILRRHLHGPPSIGPCIQVLFQLFLVQTEQFGKLVGISLRRLGLAVENGCDGNFLATNSFGEFGKGNLLGFFGGEEGVADGGEAGGEGGLVAVELVWEVVELDGS